MQRGAVGGDDQPEVGETLRAVDFKVWKPIWEETGMASRKTARGPGKLLKWPDRLPIAIAIGVATSNMSYAVSMSPKKKVTPKLIG